MVNRMGSALIVLALWLAAMPVLANPPKRFALDTAGTAVSARVAFFGIAGKSAHFPAVTGGVQLRRGEPGAIDLDVTLDARALRAGDSVTLARLKGPSFFDVERHPTVRFLGRSMKMTGPRTADVDGELTARGITRREVLRVTFDRDPEAISGSEAIMLNGIMGIDRRNYGMTAYSLIVGNRVTIRIAARMVPA